MHVMWSDLHQIESIVMDDMVPEEFVLDRHEFPTGW